MPRVCPAYPQISGEKDSPHYGHITCTLLAYFICLLICFYCELNIFEILLYYGSISWLLSVSDVSIPFLLDRCSVFFLFSFRIASLMQISLLNFFFVIYTHVYDIRNKKYILYLLFKIVDTFKLIIICISKVIIYLYNLAIIFYYYIYIF